MSVFDGLVFCVSGKLSKSQGEIGELIQKHGGEMAATVNKNCTHVIAPSLGSSKTKSAEDKGLPIVTEEWVDESISLGKLSDDFSLYLSGAPAGGSKKAKKAEKKDKGDDEEEEEEEEKKKPKRSKRAPKKSKKKEEEDEEEEEEEEEEEKPKKKGTKRKTASKGSDVFAGLTFCVSGKLSLSQTAVKKLITENGGSFAGSVTKAVTHVLGEDIGSSKTQSAVDKGLPVVREAWLNKSIEDGKLATDDDLFVSKAGSGSGSSDDPPAAKKSRPSRSAKKKKKDDDDDGDDDGDDDEDDKPKSKKAAKSDKDDTPKKDIRKVVVKGSAPVDDQSGKAATCHVYEETGCVWDAMLNQTNIGQNNNKYYIIQLLQDDNNKSYYVWNRWGRVGKTAGKALIACGSDLEKAKKEFKKKFKDKTKNDWDSRDSFKSYNGKYTMLQRDYKADAEDAEDEKGARVSLKDIPDSKLDDRVQTLIKLICDVEMMKKAMIEVGYDAKKLPLGRLHKKTIQQGYEVLKQISDELDKAKPKDLSYLSSEFYTLIPHDFGFQVPPVIKDRAMLKQKLEMVEALADIEIATKLLKDSSGGRENPIDVHYQKLKCGITPVDRKSEEWEIIQEYVTNTHAKTHNKYGLTIKDIFEMDREGELDKYGDNKKNKNRMLLWHGSRLTNFVGIISQGLRIAPPEAPVTGYMFGKGVYFADMVSKSANYCNTSRDNNNGCMLLCEVALGKCNNLYASDYYADKLPAGCLSTKGCGSTEPDASGFRSLKDGTVVPCGNSQHAILPQATSLLYNEYIVYDVSQIRIRYLINMQFDYKK